MYYSVRDAKDVGDYRIQLLFDDGKCGVFDMSGYLDQPIFRPLRNKALFSCVKVGHGTVVWPGDVDIAPERLYADCEPLA